MRGNKSTMRGRSTSRMFIYCAELRAPFLVSFHSQKPLLFRLAPSTKKVIWRKTMIRVLKIYGLVELWERLTLLRFHSLVPGFLNEVMISIGGGTTSVADCSPRAPQSRKLLNSSLFSHQHTYRVRQQFQLQWQNRSLETDCLWALPGGRMTQCKTDEFSAIRIMVLPLRRVTL